MKRPGDDKGRRAKPAVTDETRMGKTRRVTDFEMGSIGIEKGIPGVGRL
jgi:hypothetical protein